MFVTVEVSLGSIYTDCSATIFANKPLSDVIDPSARIMTRSHILSLTTFPVPPIARLVTLGRFISRSSHPTLKDFVRDG